MTTTVWQHATLVTCDDPNLGIILDGALVTHNDKIVWVGPTLHLPSQFCQTDISQHDLQDKVITPGLIDSHTHLVYAGTRVDEFAARLQGASYQSIATQGGGIQSTVRATRAVSEQILLAESTKRLRAMLANGVTMLEIKSGYGLDLVTERKMLRVARTLAEKFPVNIITTFLGAHALPLEFVGDRDGYIDYLCREMLPILHAEGLIDHVDCFCETIGFNLAQTEKLFRTAEKLKLPVKIHAEQLSDSGAAILATRFNALSADHLEFINEHAVQAMANAGTIAVLLPGAFYFLREQQIPPIHWLRQYGVPMAIATDCNPGSSPTTSLLLAAHMACCLFQLTIQEAILGITLHAAKALGKAQTHGSLTVGKQADFVIWDCQDVRELVYHFGTPKNNTVIFSGKNVS